MLNNSIFREKQREMSEKYIRIYNIILDAIIFCVSYSDATKGF